MKICPNCHSQIPDQSKFCANCGMRQPVQTVPQYSAKQPLQAGPQYSAKQPVRQGAPYGAPGAGVPRKKKKSAGCAIVALILIICIAGVAIGSRLLYVKFIKPVIASIKEEEDGGKKSYEDVKFTDLGYPKGKSEAFSLEPVEGITISAKEGALWEDPREEVSFTEIEDEEFYEEYAPVLEDMGSTALVAYDFDLGLEPEEAIPGTVELTFDLKAMGIPENLWEDIEIYRQREEVEGIEYEDPMDGFEKFATDLSGEGVLSVSTSRNCAIWVAITALFVKVAAVLSIPVIPGVLSVGGLIVLPVVYLVGRYWALPKYQHSEQHKHFKEDSTMTIEIRGKYDYDVMVDLRDTELADEYSSGGNYKNNLKALKDYSKELEERAEKEYYKEILRQTDDGRVEPAILKFIRTKDKRKAAMEKLTKADFMKDYIAKDEKLQELAKKVETPDSVKATIGMINQSYDYLKESSIKIPNRVVEFDLLPNKDMGGSQVKGLQVKKLGIDSYMTLNIDTLLKNKAFNPEMADSFRLSCVHELFHVCQEEYVASQYDKDTRIEEAAAGVLEMDASIHWYAEGIQTHDPDPAVSGAALDYVKRINNFCYGVPLNRYPLDYSDVSKTDRLIGKNPKWLINIGYTESDLIDYLRDNKKYFSISHLMREYAADKGHTHFADILRKTCGIKTDEEWRELFQKFILSHTAAIMNETFSTEDVLTILPKCFTSIKEYMSGKGDVYVWELEDAENTAYVKRFFMKDNKKKNKENKAYIAIAELDEDSAKDKNVMVRLLNAGGEAMVGERNYTDPYASTLNVLFSNTCGSEKRQLTLIFLFEPDEPKMAINTDKGAVKVSAPEPAKKLKKYGKVTALRTVLTDNKTGKSLTHDEPADSDRLGKSLIFSLSDLGASASGADLSCKQAWVYVDRDGKEYVGPFSGEKNVKNEEDPPEPEEPYEEREEPETEEDHSHFTKSMYVTKVFESDWDRLGVGGQHYKDPVTISVDGDECTIMIPGIDEFSQDTNENNYRRKVSPMTIRVKGVKYRREDDSPSVIYKGGSKFSVTDAVVEEDDVIGFESHNDPNEKSGLLFSREKYEFFTIDSGSKNFYISYSSNPNKKDTMVCGVRIPVHFIRTSQLAPDGEHIWEDTPRYYDGKPYEKDSSVWFSFEEVRD
ncbi:MAG: zinc-ribbon domain-containing protein [Lachnospiraceae bacterium]|nr:zinc-ribbon domain-containing protein [Lachnospiraceae bacterium]